MGGTLAPSGENLPERRRGRQERERGSDGKKRIRCRDPGKGSEEGENGVNLGRMVNKVSKESAKENSVRRGR